MRAKPGFTLIEILVVLIIIGTAATFAMLSFGDFGKSRQARAAAEQLTQYITLLQQKAILENRLLGLSIRPKSYQAKIYMTSQGWHTINKSSVYREQPLPRGLQFYYKKKNINNPVDIIIQTSGDITPFTLYIGGNDKKKVVRITGKANGEMVIHG